MIVKNKGNDQHQNVTSICNAKLNKNQDHVVELRAGIPLSQEGGHLVAFKRKRAILKFLVFKKIDSKDFEYLSSFPALLFLNLF